MTRIICHLPFPVSLNSIWRAKKSTGSHYRSTPYQNWQKTAGVEWLTQKQNQPRAIYGPFKAILIVAKKGERKGDIDNLIKGVLDFAVAHQLIEDDHLCLAVYARWGTGTEAPKGCKLVLRSAANTKPR